MAKERNKRWEQIKQRLQHRYRLVVMNDETFEEVGSYRLTWMNVYISLSVILVTLVTLVSLLFVLTPIKQYLPGYESASQNQDIYKIERKLYELEAEVKAREIYLQSIRNALTNNVEYKPEKVEGEVAQVVKDTTLNVQPNSADYQLRRAVETGQFAGNTNDEVKSNFTLSLRTIEQMFFVPPIQGTTSAGFRPDKKHYGIDIIAPRNTPIKAVADGVVITSDWTYDTGNVIAVQHENNIISFYKHNSVLLKKVGSFVKAGEAVAIIGNTGELTDGPHLHFELWYNGNPVDPSEYIKFN
jgi:murein DD-endopeptidase MepM/ murein hydrolase activator NlpD